MTSRTTGMKARVVQPFHYHSLPVPGGTATQGQFLTDRQVAFSLAAALGSLAPTPAMPRKDYRRDLMALPFVASVFETTEPRLLPPLAKRLNLDGEGGLTEAIQNATGTGNLKTFFSIQEVATEVEYTGIVVGEDPFDLASEAEGARVDQITVHTGRHRSGMLVFERHDPKKVRLNVHTLGLLGRPESARMAIYVLHDLQVSVSMTSEDATTILRSCNPDGWGRT